MTSEIPSTDRMLSVRLSVVSACIPIAFCGLLTWLFGYDAPYWDQWWKIPLIVKAFEGTIGIADYWTLINEHRVFFPNLITIPLARLTHWTIGYELALTLTFGVATFGLIAHTILKGATDATRGRILRILPIISLLMFSYSQHNIWMWGLHLMIPLTLLAMLVSIRCLIVHEFRPAHLIGAIVAAIVASYSFGAGLVIWGVGGILLTQYAIQRSKQVYIYLGFWIATCIATLIIYFIGYESTPADSTAQSAIQHPLQYLLYILAYLGGPIIPFHGTAAIGAGVCGIACSVLLVRTFERNVLLTDMRVRFALSLMVLAFGCAALTGLKQWPEGADQAISSRYLMWPTMYWIGILILSVNSAVSLRFNGVFRTAVIVFALFGTALGAYHADERHDAFELGKEALRTNTIELHLLYMYPSLDVPQEMRDDLVRYQLSIFRDSHEGDAIVE